MKKLMILFSMVFLVVFMAACGSSDEDTPNNESTPPADESQTDQNTNDDNTDASDENSEADKSDENSDSDQEDTNKDDDPDSDKDKATNQDDMKKMMEDLDFYEIEVEVSYGHDKEYKIEIEHHSNGDIEAEVEDELNGKDINDDLDAFNYIYPYAKKLKVDQNIDKQTTIDSVLEAFELENNYEKIEIEFEFEDGTKLSFEDKK